MLGRSHLSSNTSYLKVITGIVIKKFQFLIVLCFGVEFLCGLHLLYVFIFLVKIGYCVVTYWVIAAHSAYDMFFQYKYLSVN